MGGGHLPLGVGGYLTISNGKRIRIRRIHIEEDPARLVHPSGMGESTVVLIDYNRSGNPLIEIVTEPDISSPSEAREFLDKLRRILIRIGILDPDIDVAIRADANVSIGKSARIEIKNIGSPADVEKALSFEIVRIRNYLKEGVSIIQETRHWDERRRITVSIREKEFEEEYRYFPDPNIPVIELEDVIAEALREFPKLEDEIYEELISRYGLSEEIASVVSRDAVLYEVFNETITKSRVENIRVFSNLVSKLLVNEGKRLLNQGSITPEKLIELLGLLGKMVLEGLLTEGEARKRLLHLYSEERRLEKIPDDNVIRKYVEAFLERSVLEYRGRRLRDYVVGQVTREMESDGWFPNPAKLARIVEDMIEMKESKRASAVSRPTLHKPMEYTESIARKKTLVRDAIRIGSGWCLVTGWLESKMNVGGKLFIILRDWSGRLQCVSSRGEEAYKILSELPRESFVALEGQLRRDKRAPNGVELKVEKVLHLGGVSPPPLSLRDVSRSSIGVRLRHRYLDLRRQYMRSIMSLRAKLLRVLREFFVENGFVEINTPKIITTATEGGAELFPLLFYGREAFLAQSPQLYKQMALNMFEKVFEIDSYYRAQKFDTPRHLAEFWSIDVEASLYTLDDLLNLLEEIISYSTRRLKEIARDELMFLKVDLSDIRRPLPRITYMEALEILRNRGLKIRFGEDLGAEELRHLSMDIETPYFIVYWPSEIRAFYYKPKPDDPRLTLSFDFMWPLKEGYPLELASGGERINDPVVLSESLKKRGLYPEAYSWYIDMFKYGMPPHGGFGLGLDRLIMAYLDLSSILDTVFSPRTPKHSRP